MLPSLLRRQTSPAALLRMAESTAKRLKTGEAPKTIGTHNGHFHADEALAVYMLRKHIPSYAHATLVRTRDPARLAECHTVVDVGGVYDAAQNRYDHHQRGFDTTFPGRPTKLSSAGLVYMHFGKEIISWHFCDIGKPGLRKEAEGAPPMEVNTAEGTADAFIGVVWRKIYESFVEALDAHDNGISAYEPAALQAAGVQKRFEDGGFTLGAMVGRLNPSWNDAAPSDPAEAQAAEDARFELASQRIGEEFDRALEYYAGSWWPARSHVEDAFHARAEFDEQGRILVFKGQSVPWKDHLYTLEAEAEAKAAAGSGAGKVLYVLYPENTSPSAKWRVQCVPVSSDSFQSRKPLPEAWRGYRDEQLDGISGIEGGVFVHAAGFIGGNKTFEGALAMAKKALEE